MRPSSEGVGRAHRALPFPQLTAPGPLTASLAEAPCTPSSRVILVAKASRLCHEPREVRPSRASPRGPCQPFGHAHEVERGGGRDVAERNGRGASGAGPRSASRSPQRRTPWERVPSIPARRAYSRAKVALPSWSPAGAAPRIGPAGGVRGTAAGVCPPSGYTGGGWGKGRSPTGRSGRRCCRCPGCRGAGLRFRSSGHLYHQARAFCCIGRRRVLGGGQHGPPQAIPASWRSADVGVRRRRPGGAAAAPCVAFGGRNEFCYIHTAAPRGHRAAR